MPDPIQAPSTTQPLIRPDLVLSPEGPFLAGAELRQSEPRETSMHHHPRGQLMGALSGLVSVAVEREQWVVPAIHAIWIPPHCAHAVRSHGPFSGWSVFIEEVRCADLPAVPRAIRTTALLREAVHRAASWPGATLDVQQTRIAEVIVDEVAAAPAELLRLPSPHDARLARVTDALACNLSDARRLEEWAAWAGLSARTMSRRFIAETGMSFAQWRQQARLLRALELVADGVSVTAIAFELGYDNVSAFIDMFRRATGHTPGRYKADKAATRPALLLRGGARR
ncbi:helix-turn-helix transcriptional regulator [Caballeronia sp. INDeC2]|uniref:AraC family transcriptional regulator n=1 Tax=Caballeronia sp. INDeC2 TaxID=2921747 RepID=UPI002028932E|nr:helix-turn-helix transcriptional regulator [Caballeronia sp. INDeC2]